MTAPRPQRLEWEWGSSHYISLPREGQADRVKENPEHSPLTIHFNQPTDKHSRVAIPMHRTCHRLFKTLLVSMETKKSTLAERAAGNCKLRCPKLPLQHISKPSFGKRNSSSGLHWGLGLGGGLKKDLRAFPAPSILSDTHTHHPHPCTLSRSQHPDWIASFSNREMQRRCI